jgi:hypothetical protein
MPVFTQQAVFFLCICNAYLCFTAVFEEAGYQYLKWICIGKYVQTSTSLPQYTIYNKNSCAVPDVLKKF